MAVLAVPVRPIDGRHCSEREAVHGDEPRQQSGPCPGREPDGSHSQQRLLLSSTLLGLDWCNRGGSWRSGDHFTQPPNCPVPVHLHHLGVLPPAGQAFYDVPVHAADSGQPPAAPAGGQVRP